jgi:hypothetical protein
MSFVHGGERVMSITEDTKLGERFAFGERLLVVKEIDNKTVRYQDCYCDGYVAERVCSRIQWDLDLKYQKLVEVRDDSDTDVRVSVEESE